MQSFDDDERDGAASPTASSENYPDETMEDVDDNEMDVDGDAEGDNDDENEDNDDNEEDDPDDNQDSFLESQNRSQSHPPLLGRLANSNHSPTPHGTSLSSQASATANDSVQPRSASQPNPTVLLTSPSPRRSSATPAAPPPFRPSVRPEALTAPMYDIAPTIAAPHSTSINTVTATPDMRWVFTGGSDGYIRKFNWIDSANSKVMLTVAQRHPFVDSVTKAGVLISYWENEEPQIRSPNMQQPDDNLSLSPVYSLAVHSQGLWLLSGLESGGINLQSVRHDEGKRITCLRKHTSAVSILTLADDEKSLLSGSWDKTMHDWDLNTGQLKQSYQGSGGQISAIEFRPFSNLPVPDQSGDIAAPSNTLSSTDAIKPFPNGILTNGVKNEDSSSGADGVAENPQPSPTDSLFGGNDVDSLFGDNDDASGASAPGVNFGEDEDDEFSRAIANGIQQQKDEEAEEVASIANSEGVTGQDRPKLDHVASNGEQGAAQHTNGITQESSLDLANGILPEETSRVRSSSENKRPSESSDQPPRSDMTFLAASFDGTIRIWDRRQPKPVAQIVSRNAPPWCMNACWSPDGNFIYAGRRNGTVEEFSLHRGFREPERTFRFPQGSGAVSAVKAMPNGRHLICASFDILRMYDLKEQQAFKHSTVPFLIVPGHRGGVVSSLYVDPTCRYLISTSGNRGWEGSTTEVLLGYEISVGV
ncbi:MAG: Transcription factor spt8 [Sclerophora amabilis]|nr:MAG: Transcription factor spt8 [Sclerophora amabilis]